MGQREMIIGKTIDESLEIKNKDIASYLKLPPVKLHCSMLAEDAIKNAIKNYKDKKKKDISEEKAKKRKEEEKRFLAERERVARYFII